MFPELYHPKSPPKSSLPTLTKNLPVEYNNNFDQADNSVGNQIKFSDLPKPEMKSQQINKGVSVAMKSISYNDGIPRISRTEDEVKKKNIIVDLQLVVIEKISMVVQSWRTRG